MVDLAELHKICYVRSCNQLCHNWC